MSLSQSFPPKVPDRTTETFALVIAAAFLAILGYIAFQDFRLGRDLSDFGPIAAVGLPQVAVALAASFFLRRRRQNAESMKQRLYEGLSNG